MKWALIAFCLAPLLTWSATRETWIERSRVTQPAGNLAFEARWETETGLQLRIAPTNENGAVLLDLNRKAPALRYEPEEAFPPILLGGAQFNPEALPTNRAEAIQVVLKFRQETWSVYIGDRLAAAMPAPFSPPAIVAHPAAALPPAGYREARFQKTDDFAFHDDFLVPEGQENELAAWNAQSGDWSLRSVIDDVRLGLRKNAAAKAKGDRKPKAAMSPNFYSLRGGGTNAVLTAGYDFYDAYTLEAALQVGAGEGGLVFDYTDDAGYFAFTVRPEEDSDTVRLTLWRTTTSNAATRIELAAVTAEILNGQWIKLKARTFQNRIQCFVDGTQVMDIPAELPVGGRFGLFADAEAGLLFDDVLAESNHELDFLGVSDIRRHALVEQGRFFPRRRFFNLFPPREAPFLAPPESGDPQWLIVGSTAHRAHVFAADFEPEGSASELGLIAGYAGAHRPYFRFTRRRDPSAENFRLEKVTPNGIAIVLKELALARPADPGHPPESVRLMCDATGGRDLRFYRNQDLVLAHHAEASVGGASGVFVGPDTRVKISNPEYSFERTDLYTDQFEKNTAFVRDPFMRHWSSPEGQWDDVTNTAAWYKGDVFGRVAVHMPLVDRTAVHLGVADGSTTGAWVVCVSDRRLLLKRGVDLAASNAPAASVPTDLVKGYVGPATNMTVGYTIHAEGHWIWVTSGDELLLQQALPTPLAGRRIRITGFTTAQLADSLVERYNVKDCLFKESLHEWTINGGRWEVVNRFQCDPRWSHMDGESTNGLAALWSKYVFRGDFCVELYAGTRHGWYGRCGDYNLTVLNGDTTPSQGYTVTCSGWDYDQSQLYTKLYRNGSLLAQSDVYCAPRSREGNKRREHLPLVAEGRDVHGAWYYIKFRRAGHQLEYYFDNDLVFSCNDPDPLAAGSLGVWTYMNSMVVARVKIAAESVAPKPVPFTPVANLSASQGPEGGTAGRAGFTPAMRMAGVKPALPEEPPASHGDHAPKCPEPPAPLILVRGQPLDYMRPDDWEAADPVSQARLAWRPATNASPCFTLTSVLGSGTLLARCDRPPVPYPQVAGWRFDVKRTPRGLFNFYYSIGRRNAQGIYVPSNFYFHRISGEDFGKGAYRFAGESKVPGLAPTNADGADRGSWTPVEAWIPAEDFKASAADTGLLVKVEGFGNLQPGYVAQGLTGNGPGEGYAIGNFTAIQYGGTPPLTLASNAAPPSSVTVWSGAGPRPLLGPTNWSAATNGLATLGGTGLIETVVSAQWSNASACLPLAWVRPAAAPPVTCAWSRRRPETLEIRADSNYLHRAFALVSVTVEGRKVDVQPVDVGVAEVLVPRGDECVAGPGTNLAVTVGGGARTNRFNLKWADASLRPPPVLTNLEGIVPLFENFETRPPAAFQGGPRTRIGDGDPAQGSFLTVFNTGAGQRLSSEFGQAIPLARYPLLRFRYRGGAMARLSLSLQGPGVVRLSEKSDTARPVRGSGGLILDNEWHTWQGFVSDAVGALPFRPNALTAGQFRFASRENPDQTGVYTEWDVDDLVSGPAVTRNEQLAFTPHYFDFEGVTQVQMTVRRGPEDFQTLDAAQRASLGWLSISNHQPSVPEIKDFGDGLGHLFLKARNLRGQESQVTDVPFLLHRAAPKVTGAFEAATEPGANGSCLKVNVETGGGPPLDLETLKIRWDGATVRVTNSLASTLVHTPERDTLTLNWPLIFREQLNASRPDQSFKIGLSGIRDGAGNAVPDAEWPRRIAYAADHTPPTLLAAGYPSNILWTTAWEAMSEDRPFFLPSGKTVATLVRTNREPPYLAVEAPAGAGGVIHTFSPSWPLQKFPCLAFRLRRSAMATNDATRIDLALATDQTTNTIVVGLTREAGGDGNRLTLPQPAHWQSNVWESFTLDVAALSKARFPPDVSKKVAVRSLSVLTSNAVTNVSVQVQSVFVFAPWGADDRVVMDAYDESGIGGIDREAASPPEHTVVDPVALSGTGAGHGWVAMRVRDKAGNPSLPLYLPVYGRDGATP